MLKPAMKFPGRVKLTPFSGVQFLDFDCAVPDPRGYDLSFWEEPVKDEKGADQVELHIVTPVEAADDFSVPLVKTERTGKLVPEDQAYRIRADEAVKRFHRRWLPLPVFRVSDRNKTRPDRFARGPMTWARVYIIDMDEAQDAAKPKEGDKAKAAGKRLRVIVAFDTAIEAEDGKRQLYPAPTDEDSRTDKTFHLADSPNIVNLFLKQPWVDQWLHGAMLRHDREESLRRLKKVIEPVYEEKCKHWAYYLTLLRMLNDPRILEFPEIGLVDIISRDPRDANADPAKAEPLEPAVDVDLVLDIGNSRTCGMLIERHNTGQQTEAIPVRYSLELRDLSRPEHIYPEAFASQIEFAKPDFGFMPSAHTSGRFDAFLWPSLVRTGQEAVDLCVNSHRGEGATGMSSPKRYLWDTEPFKANWQFNTSLDRTREPPSFSKHPTMLYLTEGGEVLSKNASNPTLTAPPSMFAKFSRSSLFTFLLHEIISQALLQINAPANRMRHPFADRRRQLRRLVFTVPPGLSLEERTLFKRRAKDAVALTWECLHHNPRGDSPLAAYLPAPPQIEDLYDEATATQVVYLYSELSRLQKGAADLFRIHGRQRAGAEGRSLRVASVDIGGGTTDLMVTTFEVKDNQSVIPAQNFRESFRTAGDDVLRRVIVDRFLKSIHTHLESFGVLAPRILTSELFGADIGNMSEQQRQLRRRFVVEVAVPIGLELLRRCETDKGLTPPPVEHKALRDFFTPETMPSETIQNYVNEAARAPRIGAAQFSLLDVPVEIDVEGVNNSVHGVLSGVIANLCEVAQNLQCDLLLLSGRPSRLPIVKRMIFERLPLTPDRVISMHDYRVGSWYPFRNHLGQIDDPKTTTAVGAMLMWLARQGRIRNFSFQAHMLKHKSTARFIGRLDEYGVLYDDEVRFSNLDLDADGAPQDAPMTINLYNEITLGARQLPISRWNAAPLYQIGFKRDDDRRRVPWLLTIVRRKPNAASDQDGFEQFKIESAISAPDDNGAQRTVTGEVFMRLQTLNDASGYWLDTGALQQDR